MATTGSWVSWCRLVDVTRSSRSRCAGESVALYAEVAQISSTHR